MYLYRQLIDTHHSLHLPQMSKLVLTIPTRGRLEQSSLPHDSLIVEVLRMHDVTQLLRHRHETVPEV